MAEQTDQNISGGMLSGPVDIPLMAKSFNCEISIVNDAISVVGNDQGRVYAWLSIYLKPKYKNK